ncbi:Glycerophosphodiester phosphodiesterase GDPD4 [Hibiscus syriacus]|uniref:glycerophosphodiester phosphodiesterase n=1 Tax=Hibiscus syriacus TaxID=106335 RepID=A0A6A3AVU4_HIBSY|nr:Glycerophosphodiester phosphodiesterase GDPD4 [Hibiscus syriacus]
MVIPFLFIFADFLEDLQRISGNSTSKVGHLRSHEIKELDVYHQSGNSKIPTIEEALTFITASVRQVILDAKVGPPLYEKELAKDILSAVEKMRCKNCLVWAKSDSLVRDIIKLSSDLMVGYIIMVDPHTGARCSLFRMKGAKVTGVYHQLIDERLVKTLHGREKKVYAWTVDDADSMTRMLHAHTDAIVTSNPSLLQRTMQDKRTQCLEEGLVQQKDRGSSSPDPPQGSRTQAVGILCSAGNYFGNFPNMRGYSLALWDGNSVVGISLPLSNCHAC